MFNIVETKCSNFMNQYLLTETKRQNCYVNVPLSFSSFLYFMLCTSDNSAYNCKYMVCTICITSVSESELYWIDLTTCCCNRPRLLQMVMTTGGANIHSYSLEQSGIEDIFRASPEPGSYYRCPVSTPLHGKRHNQQKIPESVTFVSLDFSKVKSSPKQNVYRGMPAGKKIAPRRKNMDYYYVDKSFQKRIAKQSNTTWLRGLCAQPVEEIFTKYRKQSEFKRQNTIMTRSFSTPGEKAILEGWESNSSKRLSSATSRSSLQSLTTQETTTPPLQVVSKPYRQNGSDGDVTRASSRVDANPHLTTPGETPRESGLAFNDSSPQSRQNKNLRESSSVPLNISPTVDDQYYDQFKRQYTRLPDIHKKSYSFQTRQRKYYSSPNLYSSPREPSPTFKGGLAPAQKLEASGALNCSLCAWDENADP